MNANVATQLKPYTDDLLDYDEVNLFEELGRRGRTLQLDYRQMGDPGLQPSEDAALLGPLDELKDLGIRIAKRWIIELQQLVCGRKPEDEAERKEIQSVLKLTGSDLAAGLAAFLVSTFYIASPIAAVVGVIIVKRLGSSALDEICKKSDDWIKNMK